MGFKFDYWVWTEYREVVETINRSGKDYVGGDFSGINIGGLDIGNVTLENNFSFYWIEHLNIFFLIF